ncbi:MAG: tetratricopeptide repeat protein, partial [Chloroflexota bacterium]|nr:tetratricopeptide repeat protein [Chloroflexota bacterium]
ALQQYEVCRRTLEAELGLEPAAETIDLYEQIRAGRVLTRHPSAQLAPSRRHNLPAAPTSLLGRETELAHVDALMHAPDSRLVTICGPGGVGKTSLALQVARAALTRFQDGVWFVDLTALTDPALVSAAIARVLDIQESGNQGLGASLEAYLRDRQLLLVVDNFEHLLGAAPVIARLLAATTRLVVLATSRAPLHVRGEHELPLDPLAPPETTDLATVALSPAARLFVERAQAILPSFQLTPANAREIAEICAHLDGMPLAIELAAARVKLLPPHDLLLRLEQRVPGRLKVLAGGARDLPERHQTLRATLNWSYNLLSAYEQRLFRWLAVFGSSCTLAAVEAVCADMDASIDILEGVASLLDKSLIRQAPLPASGNRRSLTIEPRFSMFETIREYARELLERSGEAKVLHARHAEYYVRLAEQVEPALSGGPQQATLLRWLVEEHDNLRLAFTWAVQEQHVQIALRLTIALRRFWLIHGPISEGRTWLGLALALPQTQAGVDELRAWALAAAGNLALRQADVTQAEGFYNESLTLFKAGGHTVGMAWVLLGLGLADRIQARPDRAQARFVEGLSLFQEARELHGIFHAYQDWSSLKWAVGDVEQAMALLEELIAWCRRVGDHGRMAIALKQLGAKIRDTGDYGRAITLLEESIVLLRTEGDTENLAKALRELSETALLLGDYQRAISLAQESLAHFEALGYRMFQALLLHNQGHAALRLGDFRRATELHRAALQLFHDLGLAWGVSLCLMGLAGVAAAQGAARRAARIFGGVSRELPEVEVHRREYERNVAAVRIQLDDAEFAAAWVAGQAMTLEQVMAYVLEADA